MVITIFRINCQRQKKRRVQKFARTNNGLVAFLNMRQELELQPTGEIKEHKASAELHRIQMQQGFQRK